MLLLFHSVDKKKVPRFSGTSHCRSTRRLKTQKTKTKKLHQHTPKNAVFRKEPRLVG